MHIVVRFLSMKYNMLSTDLLKLQSVFRCLSNVQIQSVFISCPFCSSEFTTCVAYLEKYLLRDQNFRDNETHNYDRNTQLQIAMRDTEFDYQSRLVNSNFSKKIRSHFNRILEQTRRCNSSIMKKVPRRGRTRKNDSYSLGRTAIA